jgi:hypothetical protein
MRSALATLALLSSVTPLAHASYYVVDNPAPAPVSALIRSMPNQPQARNDSQTVNVPFARKSSQISREAIRALSSMLDSAQDSNHITVAGCGDPGDSESVAYRRATNVKAWLIDNGISDRVVSTAADGNVVKTQKGYNCVVTLSVGSLAPSAAMAYAQLVQPNAVAAPVVPTAQPVAPAPALAIAARTEQMKMIAKVLEMANAKIITPDNAVAMIAQLMKDSDAPAQASVPAIRPQPVVAQTPVVAQITVLPQAWALTANHTLKDTMSEWARSAGWKEPQWNATNPYLVAQGQTLPGDFMGALRTVSDLVPGLDFRVNAASHEITVTDAAR